MAKIIGIENVDYVSKKTNNRVQGFKLHCSYERKNVTGASVEQYYVSNNAEGIADVKVGDEVDFSYNRFGNIVAVAKKTK